MRSIQGAMELQTLRVYDLRHTFAQRLRDTGVAGEDRAVLMGHAVQNMMEHYATPTVMRLMEMANLVQLTRDTPTTTQDCEWVARKIITQKVTQQKEKRASVLSAGPLNLKQYRCC